MLATNDLIKPSKHSLRYFMVTIDLNFINAMHVLKSNVLIISPNQLRNNPHADSKKKPEDVSAAQGKRDRISLCVKTNPKLKDDAHP